MLFKSFLIIPAKFIIKYEKSQKNEKKKLAKLAIDIFYFNNLAFLA